MENNLNFTAEVGPGFIDRIEIQDTEYERNINGVLTKVEDKVWLFYLRSGFDAESTEEPNVFAALPNRNGGLIEPFKKLTPVNENGIVTITGEAIEQMECPEHLKKYLTPDGQFRHDKMMGGDDTVYASYGMYKRALGTWGCWEPKVGSKALAFATIPIGDGVREYYRMKKGEIRKDRNGDAIKQTTARVAVLVRYNPLTKTFGNANGGTPEAAIRGELDTQITNKLWRLVELPKSLTERLGGGLPPIQKQEEVAPGAPTQGAGAAQATTATT
jgi:hypothetical protein